MYWSTKMNRKALLINNLKISEMYIYSLNRFIVIMPEWYVSYYRKIFAVWSSYNISLLFFFLLINFSFIRHIKQMHWIIYKHWIVINKWFTVDVYTLRLLVVNGCNWELYFFIIFFSPFNACIMRMYACMYIFSLSQHCSYENNGSAIANISN